MIWDLQHSTIRVIHKRRGWGKTTIIPDWNIIWNGDPWCRFKDKTIFMAKFDTTEKTEQLFIHEATHAILGVSGHEVHFWNLMEWLTNHFLGTGLDERNKKMKQDYSDEKPGR